MPKAFSGFVFNTRRPIFADIRVREAIGLLFDFEWLNHNFFFDRYQRSASYFEGSELSARGRPADARERALLAPFPDAVRADFMDGTWQPPVTDGSGRDRDTLKRALELLTPRATTSTARCCASARPGSRSPSKSWSPPRTRSGWRSPSRAISSAPASTSRVRVVDAVQYDRRRLTYDFDMIEYRWDQSLSPGNEQAFYWGSAAADADGTRNYMGVKSPAIDAMIAALLEARERDDFVAAVRALDRVLMSGFYVVPLFHLPDQWVARWTTIAHPAANLAVRLSAGNLVAARTTPVRTAPEATDDPRRSAEADAARPARRRRSTTCSAAPQRAGPTPSRSPIRPTARPSPTARRTA